MGGPREAGLRPEAPVDIGQLPRILPPRAGHVNGAQAELPA